MDHEVGIEDLGLVGELGSCRDVRLVVCTSRRPRRRAGRRTVWPSATSRCTCSGVRGDPPLARSRLRRDADPHRQPRTWLADLMRAP